MILNWTHIFTLFNAKFFHAEANFTLAKRGPTRQHSNEDLDVYVRKFRENALYYCDLVSEEMLINVCLHVMIEEYRVLLEKLPFPPLPS